MSRKTLALVLLLLLAAASLTAVAGCSGGGAPVGEASRPSDSQAQAGQGAEAADPARTITMNGRSVMEGWMKHWGFEWAGPVVRNGYTLDYKELDGNDIAPSFASNVEGLAPGSVAFFKFCFVDFDGTNLAQREKEVERVISTARERGLRLIIGTALPVREQDGNPEMLDEYREFNAFVRAKADQNPGGVWAYDFYGVLAGPDGWLKPEYQTEDSHPNDAGYAALDPSFFELAGAVFAK